jgi:hypothetical protein
MSAVISSGTDDVDVTVSFALIAGLFDETGCS